MQLFNEDNTEGWTQAELQALNLEWTEHIERLGLEPFTEDYDRESQWFSDKVASR